MIKARRFVAVALIAILPLIIPPPRADAEWINATVVNPTASQVLLETIATSDQSYIAFCAFAASTVAAAVRIQKRDVANAATLIEQVLPLTANGTQEFCVDGTYGFSLLQGERLRVIMNSSVAGTVSVSLQDNIY